MPTDPADIVSAGSIPTRESLLARLRDLDDQDSWGEFYDLYWRLIHNVACRAGLQPAEAQEVIQETMITAARKLPGFTYDPAKDRFKGWLLHIVRYRIADQFRRRLAAAGGGGARVETPESSTADTSLDWQAIWDSEWAAHLWRAALLRLKREVPPEHYEIFHLHVIKEQAASAVARALGVGVAQVYLVKHRLGRRVQAILAELRVAGGD
jgi:RNA polymerase sigma factor (sigma-70 family)